ncbi:putative lysin [Curtobacterium phage Parvaparticeps]|nr:putative lysin [Curtobacterium phage Parvaparticeps]
MATLSSAAAILRARAQLNQPDGAGACLANVYKWFGSVQSIGPGAGHYDWAIKGWNYTPDSEKHPGDYSPPAGVPVYYGPVAAPRWSGDVNFPCGDIGLSIGGGLAIFTDGPNGNTAIMSISARAAQIGRPYFGWTESFLGHKTSAGLAFLSAVVGAIIKVVVPRKPKAKKAVMFIGIKSKKTGKYRVITESTVKEVSRARAVTYSHAVPGEGNFFMELSSEQCAGLIADVAERRRVINLPVLDAITAALAEEDAPEK